MSACVQSLPVVTRLSNFVPMGLKRARSICGLRDKERDCSAFPAATAVPSVVSSPICCPCAIVASSGIAGASFWRGTGPLGAPAYWVVYLLAGGRHPLFAARTDGDERAVQVLGEELVAVGAAHLRRLMPLVGSTAPLLSPTGGRAGKGGIRHGGAHGRVSSRLWPRPPSPPAPS